MTEEQAACMIDLLQQIMVFLAQINDISITMISLVLSGIVVYVAYYILVRFTWF